MTTTTPSERELELRDRAREVAGRIGSLRHAQPDDDEAALNWCAEKIARLEMELHAAERRCEAMESALREANETMERPWSRERILDEIRELAAALSPETRARISDRVVGVRRRLLARRLNDQQLCRLLSLSLYEVIKE